MKKLCFAAAAVSAVLFCGCDHTDVAEIAPDEGRQDWYNDIRANYPGFKRPRLVSPGISGVAVREVKTQAVEAEAVNAENNDALVAVPVDPVANDNAADKVEAPAPAPKTEVKEEAKAPEVKTEVKEEAKAEPAKAAAEANNKKTVEPPDPTNSEIYVVQYGDTLGALSKKFYGSVRYVNLLQKANSDIITNSNVLKPGMKLIIPKL